MLIIAGMMLTGKKRKLNILISSRRPAKTQCICLIEKSPLLEGL
jgi:hypothetical protein